MCIYEWGILKGTWERLPHISNFSNFKESFIDRLCQSEHQTYELSHSHKTLLRLVCVSSVDSQGLDKGYIASYGGSYSQGLAIYSQLYGGSYIHCSYGDCRASQSSCSALWPILRLSAFLWRQQIGVSSLIYTLTSYILYTVKNGSLLQHTNVSLLEHVSKIVSILLSKLAIVPILTHRCATVTTHF